jgi:homoaconitase/3-isopropylmalate dehydratase large subunit
VHKALRLQDVEDQHSIHAPTDQYTSKCGPHIVCEDAAALWDTGQTRWKVPRMVNVEIRGRLVRGATGKDVVVALYESFNKTRC